MSIEIETEAKANYMHLHCRGTYSLKAIMELFEKAFDIASREGLKAVLIDGRDVKGVPPTTLERYTFGVHVAELQLDKGRCIRLAVVANEPIVDPRRFGETVARNRGATIRVFTDIDEAIAWLDRKDAT
jgi:hypothetical protein